MCVRRGDDERRGRNVYTRMYMMPVWMCSSVIGKIDFFKKTSWWSFGMGIR